MVIVFDIGTTVIKGGIIDTHGTLLVHSRLPIAVALRPGLSPGEVSMEEWMKTFTTVAAQCMNKFHRMKGNHQLRGVVIGGNGPTLIPVNPQGHPVAQAVSWADRGSRSYIPVLNPLVKNKVNPAFYLSKAYSLFKQDYPLYEKTEWFLPCPEFFAFYLTGNPVAVLPVPGFTSFMWTKEAVTACGMDEDKFPPFVPMGEEIGKVKVSISDATGIPPHIPVFAGGPDFIMSLLGTGTIVPGRVCDRTGTSEGINICSRRKIEHTGLMVTPHIRAGWYNISSVLPFAGKGVDWFLHISGKTRDSYRQLYAFLEKSPGGPGDLLFLPHLEGSPSGLWPGYRKGLFAGLTSAHSQEQLFKAVIEGIGYAVRDVFETFHSQGLESEEVRVSGIQTSYDGWNRIRANILGKRIRVPAVWDTELTGAASIGLASLGIYSDYFEASENLVRFHKEFVPDKKQETCYNDMYYRYKRVYKQTEEIFREFL